MNPRTHELVRSTRRHLTCMGEACAEFAAGGVGVDFDGDFHIQRPFHRHVQRWFAM